MTPTLQIDPKSLANLNQAIAKFVSETGREYASVLKQQSKLLVKDLISATPPFGKSTFSESYNAQRRIGEAAVKRDIQKVFRPITALADAVAKNGNSKLAAALLANSGISVSSKTQKINQKGSGVNMDALNTIFERMGMAGRVLLEVDPKIHNSARGRRGRVKRATPYYIVKTKSIDRYIKLRQSHVGKAKAGWIKAAVGTGLRGVPKWIKQHLTPGVFVDKSTIPDGSITVGNLVSHAGDFKPSTFEAAMQNRVRGMQTQLEKIAEAQARKANSGRAV